MKKIILILLILSAFNSKGTIHQIQVWNGYFQFLPSNNITIQLGDTIQWIPLDPPTMSHTITSDNIPVGAVSFDQIWQLPADTFFQYIPQVVGLYQYVCTPHITLGMIGEFNVVNGGCTDSLAVNYDSSATFDDGSCTYCNQNDTSVIFMTAFAGDGDTAYSTVTIPSFFTDIYLDIRAAGDLDIATSEFFNIYFNGVQYGGDWSTGIQDCILHDVSLNNHMNGTNLGSLLGSTVSIQIASSAGVDLLSCQSAMEAELSFRFTSTGDCGCIDSLALNYNSLALYDDGSCCYVSGCTDSTACNYNPTACFDDSSCVYPVIWQQAFSICNGDSIVVGSSVYDTTGYYIDTLSGLISGCDTIMYTNIFVDFSTSSYDTVIACGSYDWNGTTYTSSGIYTWSPASSGTYIQTINLSSTLASMNVFNFPLTPTGATGGTLTLEASGDLDGLFGGTNEEMWTIQDESSTAIGAIGGSGNTSDQCNTTFTDVISLTAAQINAWAVDGSIDFTAIDIAGNIDVFNLCPNQFLTLTLTYDYGTSCIYTDTLALTITTNNLNLFTTSSNVSCNGDADGSIVGTATGGTLPYQYSIDGGTAWQPSGTFLNLSGGAYFVDVTDVNGCSSSQMLTINEPPALVSAVTIISVSCFGMFDGSIIATATGGTSPYQYSLGGGLLQTSGTFSNLSSGTYFIDVTDVNGCSSSQMLTINEPPILVSTASLINSVSCFGLCDGYATVVVNGGAAPYTFLWSDGQTSQTATGLCPDTYTSFVTDANNCIVQSTVIVPDPPLFSISVNSTDETSALNDGSATAIINGGTPPYTYAWNTNPPQTTNPATNLAPGLYYTVTVTDANGCIMSDSTSVNAYNLTGVINIKDINKTLSKITDMLGQETPSRRNTPLFYIYDDGTVEKRIVIE
jgi:plastocyanin